MRISHRLARARHACRQERRRSRLAATAALPVLLAVAIAGTPASASSAAAASSSAATAAQPAVAAASAEMVAALRRDLDLTPAEVATRLAEERGAATTETRLRAALGPAYGGAWLDRDGALVVAVVDSGAVDQVRATGARPRVVQRSERELVAVKATLDRAGRPASSVHAWYVDPASNRVVVQGEPAAAAAFVADSGADRAAVRVERSTERPVPLYDIRGGDPFYVGNSRCSIGFSVVGGFVTAGHCGAPGAATTGFNGVAQGVFRGSSFPGADYAWVEVNANWTPQPWVNRYDGTNAIVAGAQEAAVGASVCRSGSTTGWRCGIIQARNVTVNYPQGTVTGLTRTTACAQPGDSGGPYLAGQQAQGLLSGGSGNCTTGGTTFFQPLLPVLSRYGLTLVTASGGSTPPTASLFCESGGNRYFCDLSYTSGEPVQIRWAVNGTHMTSWDGRVFVSGSCTSSTVVAATVSNSAGSVTRSWSSCRSGPWQ